MAWGFQQASAQLGTRLHLLDVAQEVICTKRSQTGGICKDREKQKEQYFCQLSFQVPSTFANPVFKP